VEGRIENRDLRRVRHDALAGVYAGKIRGIVEGRQRYHFLYGGLNLVVNQNRLGKGFAALYDSVSDGVYFLHAFYYRDLRVGQGFENQLYGVGMVLYLLPVFIFRAIAELMDKERTVQTNTLAVALGYDGFIVILNS
jgi:hypothetical protein